MTVGRQLPPQESPYNGSWINGNTGEWHHDTPQEVIDETMRALGEHAEEDAAKEMPETAEEPPTQRLRFYSEYESILTWQAKIHEWAVGKGFWDDAPADDKLFDEVTWVMSKLMLAVSELGEACEALRKGDEANFGEELADTVIRIFDTAGAMDYDLAAIMVEKMQANEMRPRKHGKRA